jgi:hypothetical protein
MKQELLLSIRATLIAVLSAIDCLLADNKQTAGADVQTDNTCKDPSPCAYTDACCSDASARRHVNSYTNTNSGYDINLHFGSHAMRANKIHVSNMRNLSNLTMIYLNYFMLQFFVWLKDYKQQFRQENG